MMHALSLIYGDQVVDDIAFCSQHNDVIEHYSHGIMTLQASPKETLEAVAQDPASVPGWAHSLKARPQDCQVIREFLTRLITHYVAIGRL